MRRMGTTMEEKSFWLKGTIFLTLAGLLSKVLGMIYRVPLQNMAGDEGLYVYQQIYPFLSIALMLSIYSFPSAIAEVTSSHKQRKNPSGILFLFFIFGIILFTIIFSMSEKIALWMGDVQLSPAIQLAGGMFLLIPLTAYFRGVLQGLERTKYVALSQIIEQFIRVVFIILFTVFIVFGSESVYLLGSYAALATMLGTIGAAIFLFIIYKKYTANERFIFPSKKIVQSLLIGSIIYSLTYLLHLLLQFVDVFTMVNQLQAFGFSFEMAKGEKGIYDRGHALIQLGLVLGSSLALALIPALQKSKGHIEWDEQLALKVTYTLSLPATVGLIVIMPLLNPLLYENNDGTYALQIMMLLVFLLSFVILFSVLLGRHQNRITQLIWIAVMVGLKMAFNILFIPNYGIVGASLASVIAVSFLFIIFFVMWKIKANSKLDVAFLMKGIIASIIMGLSVYFTRYGLSSVIDYDNRFQLLFIVLLLCVIGVIVYSVLMIILRMFSKVELQQLFRR